MKNKALILYATSTGNTEKVAKQFAEVLEAYAWDCTSVQLEDDTNLTANGIYVDDFDLVLLGTPVISGGPSPVVASKLALVGVEPPRLYRNQMIFPGSLFRPEHSPLGVVFATYSGETFGPREAVPALDMAGIYLQYLFMDVIGKFACPGRKESKNTIDLLASDLGMSPNEIAQLMGKYERNPDDPQFLALSEDSIAMLRQAALDKKTGQQIPIPEEFDEEVWHRDLEKRPHARDLMKAKIFLSEILEDYFTEDGSAKHPGSVYTCIG